MSVNTTEEPFPSGWHRAFIVLWLGCFITGMGYSMTMPFISLFINELGHLTRFQLNISFLKQLFHLIGEIWPIQRVVN